MKIKAFIKSFGEERTFTGKNGERVVRDIVLTQVGDNPLIEEKYPNEFCAAYFAHIDTDTLNRAVSNRTVMEFDLSFRVQQTEQGWQRQRVTIDNIQ